MKKTSTDTKIRKMTTFRITIVILNWNGKADSIECLKSVSEIDYSNFDVLVVDNGSSDDSVSAIGQSFPEIKVLETGRNLGFAGGNNVGIRYALDHGADYVLLLNNDTIVDRFLIKNFMLAAGILPFGSVMSAKIYFFSDPERIWYAGAKEDDCGFVHSQMGELDDDGVLDPYETDYASGCALLASRQVIEKVGLLDSKFFLTYEETDWCYRAKKAGYKSYVVPSAKVWHKVSSSFGGSNSPLQVYFMTRNLLFWAERNLPRERFRAIFKATLCHVFPGFELREDDSTWLTKRYYWALTSWVRATQNRLADPVQRASLLGVRDYLLRKFGDCPAAVRKLQPVKVLPTR